METTPSVSLGAPKFPLLVLSHGTRLIHTFAAFTVTWNGLIFYLAGDQRQDTNTSGAACLILRIPFFYY
jgi:hypothetical protein